MNVVYNNYKNIALLGGVDLVNDTINIALMTSAYSPDIDNESFYSDIQSSGKELPTGGGYVTSGVPLTGKSVSTNTNANAAFFNASDVVWNNATFDTMGAVIYKAGSTPSTSPLLFFVDFYAIKSSFEESFTIDWNTSGVMQLS